MLIAKKKIIGYALCAAASLLVAAPMLFGGVSSASAQALTGDQLFGGATATGNNFASSAGLGNANLVSTITSLIRVALGFLGIISVVIILLGGFKWMTSGGAEDKVKAAKKLIFAGIVGLVIVLFAFAIASFVISTVITAQNGGV